ncbi:DUF4376 domain-containing protein [Escherichia coli]|nr:DUF4376 domain-containing protein [Escherichia coli]EFD4921702.1 DUF4376 domain-containing protein [Escherichia coli]EFN9647809.1 DUF4376 domain-containing protein [Escherichia coli]EFN9721584.1 DUF4376 domain-containing protein [Escherichia coli]EFN9731719.1 DUF4376 domain-containing protein [Escherichia coli]
MFTGMPSDAEEKYMGKYIFSPSRNLFYPVELKAIYETAGRWPDDGTEVDDVTYRELFSSGMPESEAVSIARRRKRAEISQWRDDQENAGIIFEWNGHRWDGGKITRSRLAPVIAVAQAGTLPAGFFWTDADNQDRVLTAEELVQLDVAMQRAMVIRGFQIHERQRQMKEEVARLESADAIRRYVVGWGDE